MNRGVITQLRDIVPIRPLSRTEHLRLAEFQAQRFLKLVGVTEPSVPERVIAELPHIQITRLSPLPVSGATQWSNGQWLIVLNGSEPLTRQRFSVAHEFKHILDHRFSMIIYDGIPGYEREGVVEQICDYFAGCLLMPRPWVKSVYCSGVQRLDQLAQTFGVSQAAMQVRLNQIGLIDQTSRCGIPRRDWASRAFEDSSATQLYERRTPALISP